MADFASFKKAYKDMTRLGASLKPGNAKQYLAASEDVSNLTIELLKDGNYFTVEGDSLCFFDSEGKYALQLSNIKDSLSQEEYSSLVEHPVWQKKKAEEEQKEMEAAKMEAEQTPPPAPAPNPVPKPQPSMRGEPQPQPQAQSGQSWGQNTYRTQEPPRTEPQTGYRPQPDMGVNYRSPEQAWQQQAQPGSNYEVMNYGNNPFMTFLNTVFGSMMQGMNMQPMQQPPYTQEPPAPKEPEPKSAIHNDIARTLESVDALEKERLEAVNKAKALADKVDELSQANTELYERELRLREGQLNLKSNAEKAENALHDAEKTIKSLRDNNEKLKKDLTTAQNEVKNASKAASADTSKALAKKDEEISAKNKVIAEKDKLLGEKNAALSEKEKIIAEKSKTVSEQAKSLVEKTRELEAKTKEIEGFEGKIAEARRDERAKALKSTAATASATEAAQKQQIEKLESEVAFLRELAFIDKMTGVNTTAKLGVDMKERDINKCYLLQVGILGVKFINENQGRAKGDRLIVNVANELKSAFAKNAIYRSMGDNFLIFGEARDVAKAKELIEKVKENLEKNYTYIAYGLSVGGQGVDRQKFFATADEAMNAERLNMKGGRASIYDEYEDEEDGDDDDGNEDTASQDDQPDEDDDDEDFD